MKKRFNVFLVFFSLLLNPCFAATGTDSNEDDAAHQAKQRELKAMFDKYGPAKQITTKELYARKAQAEHIENLSTNYINPDLDQHFTKPKNFKFDRQEWLQHPTSRRMWWMIYDLVHSHSIIGMTRSQISDLLGSPSKDSYTMKYAADINVDAYEVLDGLFFQILYLENRVIGYRMKNRTAIATPVFTHSHWVTKNFNQEK